MTGKAKQKTQILYANATRHHRRHTMRCNAIQTKINLINIISLSLSRNQGKDKKRKQHTPYHITVFLHITHIFLHLSLESNRIELAVRHHIRSLRHQIISDHIRSDQIRSNKIRSDQIGHNGRYHHHHY